VASKDSFVPLGAAAEHVLLSEDEIEKAAHSLCATVGQVRYGVIDEPHRTA
jgi:hypothetical protein